MRIKKFPRLTMLLIEWVDTVTDSAWTNEKGIEKAKPARVKTLGFFLENKKYVLKIAHTYHENESDITVIPWGCIKSIINPVYSNLLLTLHYTYNQFVLSLLRIDTSP